MVEDRLARVRERIAKLAATEERIGEAILAWRAMGDPSPVDGELCPLVERLAMTHSHVRIQGGYQNVGSMGVDSVIRLLDIVVCQLPLEDSTRLPSRSIRPRDCRLSSLPERRIIDQWETGQSRW